MQYIKSDFEWLKQHATKQDDGSYACNTTGATIQRVDIPRSWGCGEVTRMAHLRCPKCQDVPLPENAAPVDDENIIEIRETETA